SFLINAGSGALTLGTPSSPGVTEGTAKDTLTASFNDLHSVKQLLNEYEDEVGALIVEPVSGNMGCIPPQKGFLAGLRELCDAHDVVFIMDEVMTGFRLSEGGAQERFGVTADLVTYGKIIGGGLPVGAFGGKKEIMQEVSPDGPVYQAGTLSGNPLAMAAGYALLSELHENPVHYDELEEKTTYLFRGLQATFSNSNVPVHINRIGSMISIFFTEEEVVDFETARSIDEAKF